MDSKGVYLLFFIVSSRSEENLLIFPRFDDVLRKSFPSFEGKWPFLRKSFRFRVLNPEEK